MSLTDVSITQATRNEILKYTNNNKNAFDCNNLLIPT